MPTNGSRNGDLVERAMVLTFELSRVIRKQAAKRHLQKDCPNLLQIHALRMIQEHDGITMKKMAEFLKVSFPSATSFVNRLVKLGWIERVHDVQNRKLVRLHVTPKGNAVLLNMRRVRKKIFTKLLSSISLTDRRDLVRILAKLLDSSLKTATL